MQEKTFLVIHRSLQIGIALIPCFIGLLALLNNINGFSQTLDSVVRPLVELQGNKQEAWRALPASLAPFVYAGMSAAESLVGILSILGVCSMLYNFNTIYFEKAKRWIYLACGWGGIVWGLGFFEIGGDWFLAWQNNNLASLQQGALYYVNALLFVFIYLKLSEKLDA